VTDKRVRRRIFYAAAISGAVHAAVIATGRHELEEPPTDLPPLAVRLVNVAPERVPVAQRMRPQARAAKPPKVAAARPPSLPLPLDLGAPAQPEPEGVAAAAEMQAAEAPTAELPGGETPSSPVPEPTVIATAPASTLAADKPALPAFPKSGRISYTVVYGRDQFPVGRTVQSWKIDGTRYQLASRSETIGLADLLRSQHRTYLSRGELTPAGLRPETFLMSRNRGRGPEEARATFHWPEGTITLGSGGKRHDEPLPPGTHDFVSFIYQLAIDPPAPGPRQATITNGSRLQTYVLTVLPEEKIETPLGILRALPITQARTPGAETMDVWLAVEYRYLPVRLRFYGRDGEPAGEQIVTEIRLSDD
jgi:hypothetical protein